MARGNGGLSTQKKAIIWREARLQPAIVELSIEFLNYRLPSALLFLDFGLREQARLTRPGTRHPVFHVDHMHPIEICYNESVPE